ncbi:MAG: hypothetical protein JXM70_18150 [Pirellulales bacterium]|nr:hypothetical protein [Pirellulales bacterium]
MNHKHSNHNRPTIGRSNPFSTRFVRPGAIEYIFPQDDSGPQGDDAERMVARLQNAAWRGQIVGPHGTGKSALLATLLPAIRRSGKKPLLVELHDGQRRLPVDLTRLSLESGRIVLIVDGYEQLSWWSRFRLKRFCRRHYIGLLVTSHKPMGLPELYRTNPTPELAVQIVEKLLAGKSFDQSTSTEVRATFARHGGDIREMLFELYDFYEQQSRSAPHRVHKQQSGTSHSHNRNFRQGKRT